MGIRVSVSYPWENAWLSSMKPGDVFKFDTNGDMFHMLVSRETPPYDDPRWIRCSWMNLNGYHTGTLRRLTPVRRFKLL